MRPARDLQLPPAGQPTLERQRHGDLIAESVVADGQSTRMTRYRAARRALLVRRWAGVHYGAVLRYEELVELAGLDHVRSLLARDGGSAADVAVVSPPVLLARGRLRRLRARVGRVHLLVLDRLLFGHPVTGDFESIDQLAVALFPADGRDMARWQLARHVHMAAMQLDRADVVT